MNTTLKQQRDAITDAMTRRAKELFMWKGRSLTSAELLADPEWSRLNDAASTIAALKLSRKLKNDVDLINALQPFKKWAEDRLSREFKSEEIVYQFNNVAITAHDLATVLQVLQSK